MRMPRTSLMNGLAGYNYAGLRWSALLSQAQADHLAQWNARDSFDPYSSGTTNIAGKAAQIYLAPMANAFTGGGELRPGFDGDGALFGLPGHVVLFNLHDPEYVGADGTTEWMLQLSRGAGDGVVVTPYKIDDGIPWMALMLMATPFILPGGIGGGLFGGSGAAAGTVEAAGWTSGYDLAMGADLLSMTGAEAVGAGALAASEVPAWTSGYDLAMGPDLLSMTGAGAASGASWWTGAQQVLQQIGTVAKAAGTVASVTGALTSGGTRTTLPRTTQQQQVYQPVPQVTTQYVHAAPADNKTMMIGLGVGAAVLALVLLKG